MPSEKKRPMGLDVKLIELETYKKGLDEHAIIARTDLNGKIIYVNKKFCEISGYRVDELIGSDHRLINSGTHPKEFFEQMWERIKFGDSWRGEICNKAKDGSIYWVDTTILPLKDSQNEIIEFMAFRYDITEKKISELEQKKLEKELLAKNEELRRAQSISKMGSWSFCLDTGRISWTREMFNIFPEHFSDGEPDFERHKSTIHPEDVELWQKKVERCVADGKPYSMRFRTHKKDDENEIVWVEARGEGNLENDRVISISGTCQDITEAVFKDKELTLILESNQVGVWKFNPISNELSWDKGMYELFEVDEQTSTGAFDTWQKTLHEDCLERATKDFFDALSGDGNFESSFVIRTKSGIKYIGARAIIERDKNGNAIFVMGLNWDRSREQRIQDELERAEQIAKSAEHAKTEFLANMSHEIRTPMNGIVGMTDLLGETSLSLEQMEMLNIIKASSGTLLSLVNDILDLSKIEAKKLEIEKVGFDLNCCLEEVCGLLEFKAREKGIKFIKEFTSENQRWVLGDTTRLKQIIMNFLANAIKFTSEGAITIGYHHIIIKDEHASFFKLYVQDTGIGIAKEDQAKLFEAFVQADTSITRRFGGSGLGLTICSQLAKLMQGKVYLESEKGKGSTFYLEIPLEEVTQENFEVKDMNPLKGEESDFGTFYPHKILLAEDNKVNQKVVCMTLEKLGYSCDIVNDGVEVLEIMSKKVEGYYSLILMDMQMPNLDGISTTEKIIDLYRDKAPKVVALTANAFSADKLRCLEVGMVGYLSKPLDRKELKVILKNFSLKQF